jgi:hypothetical protein
MELSQDHADRVGTTTTAAGAGVVAPLGGTHNAASNLNGGGGKSPFVSALCWRKNSHLLLAANSRGGVWLLTLATE